MKTIEKCIFCNTDAKYDDVVELYPESYTVAAVCEKHAIKYYCP